jgi:hypothetical protein
MSDTTDPGPEVPEAPEATEVPAVEAPVVEAPVVEAPAVDAPAKRTLRQRLASIGERLRGTRGLIAVALAALIVGGFSGAAIHAAIDGDGHERGRFFHRDFGDRMGPGERPGDPRDFYREAPPGFPVPVPPTPTTPPTPSESSDS